jgi:hypothetical protein
VISHRLWDIRVFGKKTVGFRESFDLIHEHGELLGHGSGWEEVSRG